MSVLVGIQNADRRLKRSFNYYNFKIFILLVIDSLMVEPLQKVMKEGNAPVLKFFMEHGYYYPEIVSAYPTMPVKIDSKLVA